MLARISVKNCCQRVSGTKATVASAHTSTVSSAAGRMRRARRAQKARSETEPVRSASRSSSEVMRNPEMAKKTSTPTKPPGSTAGHRW